MKVERLVIEVKSIGMPPKDSYGEPLVVKLDCGHGFVVSKAFAPKVGDKAECEECSRR